MGGITNLGTLVAYLKADDSDFTAAMKKATAITEKTKKNFLDVRNTIDSMSNKLMLLGGGITGLGGLLVKNAAEWEQGFGDLQSVLKLTSDQIQALNKVAVDFSNNHKISSDAMTNSYYDMISAGLEYKETLETLDDVGILAIATAQPLQDMNSAMKDAVDIFTDSMNLYNDAFEGMTLDEKTTTIINTFAGTVQEFKVTLPGLREAFSKVAGDAAQAGISFQELNTALGLLITNGKDYSEAGTGLRNIINRLQTRAEEFGIEVFDSSGKMRELTDIFRDIKVEMDSYGSSTERAQAMVKLFGEEMKSHGEIILANLDLLDEQKKKITENADAYEMAAYREATLMSQLSILKNNFENLAAKLGEFLIPSIKEFVKMLGDFSKWMQQLSPETQQFIAKLIGIGGPITLLVGGFGKLIASVMSFGSAISKLHIISNTTKAFKALSSAMVNTDLLKVGADFSKMQKSVAEFGPAIGGISSKIKSFSNNLTGLGKASVIGGIVALTAVIVKCGIELANAHDQATKLFNEINEVSGGALEKMEQWYHKIPVIGDILKANMVEDWSKKTTENMQNMDTFFMKIEKLRRNSFDTSIIGEDWANVKKEMEEVIKVVDSMSDKDLQAKFGNNAAGIRTTTEFLKEMVIEGEAAQGSIEELNKNYQALIDKFNSGKIQSPEEIKSFVEEIEKFKETIPENSQKAQELNKILNELGANSKESSEQVAEASENVKKASQAYKEAMENYDQAMNTIDTQAEIFGTSEWDVLEQKVEVQKKTLEELASKYVEGKITQEEYLESIGNLSEEYQKNSAALEEHQKQVEKQKEIEEGLTETLEKQSDARKEFSELIAGMDEEIKNRIELARLENDEVDEAKIKQEVYTDTLKKALELKEEMGAATAEELEILENLKRKLEDVANQQREHAKVLEEQKKSIEETSKAYEEQLKTLEVIGESISNFSGSNAGYVAEGEKLKEQYSQLVDKLQGYKKELEEIEKLQGTDSFDSERVKALKTAIEATGLSIEKLGVDFENLSENSDLFSGIVSTLNLDLEKSRISFEVWGDSFQKMRDDIEAHKKAIESLIDKKAQSGLNATEEAKLEEEKRLYKELTEELEKQEEALKKAEEAKQAFASINDSLNKSLVENEKAFELETSTYEEYLKNKVTAYKNTQDELVKLAASRDLTEEEAKKLGEVTSALNETERALESYTRQKEKSEKINENFSKSTDELSKKLKELNESFEGNALEKAEKKYEILSTAVKELSEDFEDMDSTQKEAFNNLADESNLARKELEKLKEPFEEIEKLQQEISEIDLEIDAETDADKKLELIKEKIELLKEVSEITITLPIEDKEIQEKLNEIKSKIQKEQNEITKITVNSAKEQIDAIKKATKGSVTETLKSLKELKKKYEEDFKNNLLKPDEYASIIENVAEAIEESTQSIKDAFESIEDEYSDRSPIDILKENTREKLAFLKEVEETGLYDLERIYELRQNILRDAAEKEKDLLEGISDNYLEAMGGDVAAINSGLKNLRDTFDKREEMIKKYASAYQKSEEWLSEQLEKLYQERKESTSGFFEEYISGYTSMFDNFEDMDIFQQKEAVLAFKMKFPSPEEFKLAMEDNLNSLKNLGEIDDTEYLLGMEQISETYYDIKGKIENTPIEITANVENALEGLEKSQVVLENMARVFREAAKSGGEFGDMMDGLADMADVTGNLVGGAIKTITGIGSGNFAGAVSGIGDIVIGLLNLQGAWNNMLNSEEESKKDKKWAKGKSLSEVLDFDSFAKEANFDFWDNLHFFNPSAAQQRWIDVIKTTLDEQVKPLIEDTRKMSEEYSKLGEEAKESGMDNLAEYYVKASEKLSTYADKIETLQDKIIKNTDTTFNTGYGVAKKAGQEIEEIQKQIEDLSTFTDSMKGAYDELGKHGLEDSAFASALEEMAKEATEAMEKGLDFGPIAEKAENFKALLETVGPSLQKVAENLSHLGLASGKYSEEINNLNQAYLDGKITQEEYIQSIETLSDKIEILSATHKKVDEAISKSGKASVFLKEQLNELDKAFTDGEKSESEYLKSLEELGVKSEKIAGSYEIIREAVQKVGVPVEVLAEKFNELVDSFDSGAISEEQFMAGLDMLKDKAETVVTAFNRFDESIGKINSAFDGTDITIGQRFTEEFQELRTALENGEIDLNTFLEKIGELSSEAERFYSTFEGVKNTISSGLSGALENYITFEFDDSMMGDLQAFVERTKGAVYESSEDFATAFSEMGKAGQTALIEEFKYDKFKQSLDETLKKAILDSLLESLMAEAAIQGQIQQLSAFIAAAMKDGLSQGEMDAMKTMMGDMQAVASEMASVVAETWTGLDNEIQTSSEEIQQIISDTLSGVEEIGDEAKDKIADTGQSLADELNTELGRIPEQVGEQTQQIVDETTEKVKEIPKIVDEALVDTGATIADSIGDIPEEVKNQTDQATQELKSGLETLPGVVSEITGGVVTELGNMYAAINPDGTIPDGLTEITEMAANKMAILEEFKANMAGTVQETMGENLGMLESETLAQLLDISKQTIDGQLGYFNEVLGQSITDSGVDIDTLTTDMETEFSMLIDAINIKTDEYSAMRLQKQTESMNRYKLLANETGTELSNMVNSVYSAIEGYAQRTAGTIQSVMQALLGNIRAVISQAQEAMQAVRQAQAASASGSSSSSSSRPTYKAFADGGLITSDGLAYLHTGEMVVPRIATGKIFGQDIPNISNNSTSNSSQITVSIAEGAIRVVGGNTDPEAVAEKVMEKLATGLSDSARRYSEVKP